MKIYIIGPSAAGKTTLAKLLSKRFKTKRVNLDYVLYEHTKPKKRKKINESEYLKNVDEIVSQNSWIIEGVQLLNRVC